MIPKTNAWFLKKEEEKTHSTLPLSAFLAAGLRAYCHHQQGPWKNYLVPLCWGQSLHVKQNGHSHPRASLLVMVNNKASLHP